MTNAARNGRESTVWRRMAAWLLAAVAVSVGSCGPKPPAAKPTTKPAQTAQRGKWRYLFDGKTLKGWVTPDWGGSGKVYVKDGVMHLEMGESGTGATYRGKIPRDNYEIALEGMRVDGWDFFCGLTFPVGKDPISLILGGWGGSVCGLSCLDGLDASENETTQIIDFKQKKWYRVRVRVTPKKIRCWLDDKKIIDVARKGRKIDIRPECEQSLPLGICTWITHGAIKNIRIRELAEGEE